MCVCVFFLFYYGGDGAGAGNNGGHDDVDEHTDDDGGNDCHADGCEKTRMPWGVGRNGVNAKNGARGNGIE